MLVILVFGWIPAFSTLGLQPIGSAAPSLAASLHLTARTASQPASLNFTALRRLLPHYTFTSPVRKCTPRYRPTGSIRPFHPTPGGCA